jgi:thiol-disulfide isomerase/thioredoxin
MKNRIAHVLMMMLIPAFSFAQGFVIKGKVPGIISGYARIDAHANANDTVDLIPEKVRIVNGEFELRGKLYEPKVISLYISTKRLMLFLENSNYAIESDFASLNEQAVKGGALHTSYANFRQENPLPEDYVRKYPSDPLSAWLLKTYLFDKADKLKELYHLLTPEAKESYYGLKVKALLDPSTKPTLTGKPVPASVLTDPDGKQFSWDRFRGKFLVVDFWASWCAPCRKFIPTLKKTYEKYAAKGIGFISVSVDDRADLWKRAMTEEQMPWPQGLGQHGFSDAGLKTAFLFNSIPYMIVIGPDGKVVSEIDFYKKERLENELDRLISEKK